MIAVNEMGIYEALYASRKLEAGKLMQSVTVAGGDVEQIEFK